MNKTLVLILAAVIVIGTVLFFVYSSENGTGLDLSIDTATTTQTDTQDQNNTSGQNTQTDNTTGTSPEAVASNSVVLGETEAGNVVTVTQATLAEPGYVVLYRINSNGDASIAGNSDLLEAGTHSDIAIQLDNTAVDRQALVATLHEDDGDGEFSYPESDGYLLVNGMVVNDIDVVGVSRSDRESQILETQVESYLENNFDGEATVN